MRSEEGFHHVTQYLHMYYTIQDQVSQYTLYSAFTVRYMYASILIIMTQGLVERTQKKNHELFHRSLLVPSHSHDIAQHYIPYKSWMTSTSSPTGRA